MYKKTTVCAKWYIPCIFFVREDGFIGARDKSPERRIVIVCGVIQL